MVSLPMSVVIDTSQGAADSGTVEPSTDDIAAMRANRRAFGLPSDEAVTRATLELAIAGRDAGFFSGTPMTLTEQKLVERQQQDGLAASAVAAKLEPLDTFAGVWLEKDPDIRLIAAFTGPTPAPASLALQELGPIPYELVHRKWSMREMMDAVDLLAASFAQNKITVALAPDARSGEIDVWASESVLPLVRDIGANAKIEIPIKYDVASVPVFDSHGQFMAGGLRYQRADNVWWCTMGLPYRTQVGLHPRMTTAGHCIESYPIPHMYRGAELVGIYITHIWGGSLDTAVFGPGSGAILTDDIVTYNNVGAINGAVDLAGAMVPQPPTTICESQGRSGRTRCGQVLNSNATVTADGVTLTGMIQADFCAKSGDSGAATYYPVSSISAYGVGNHSSSTGGDCVVPEDVWIVKNGTIESTWQLALFTSG
jgi:hypothetical protein